MRGTIRMALALACAGALAGCGMETLDPPAPGPSGGGGQTGLALTIDLSEVESVAGVRFIVETCEGEEVVVDERRLEELDFSEDEAFAELGVDGRQGVIFADYFVVLEEGCYDVEIVPIDEDGEEVDLCEPSLASGVEVRAGQTTEIAMVSQCGGDNFGAMDVLGVLNFSPTITRLDFDPSKLVACEQLTICATAVDSDADDIEFEWEQLSGPTPREGIEVRSTSDPDADGQVVECVTLTPGNTAAYAFEVRAYDVIVDRDGDRVRVEDLLQANDDDARSHARLSFPVYATCDEAPDDDEGVLGEVEDEPGDDHRKDKERPEQEEDVLGEVEEPEEHKKKDHRDEEEDVLGEVEEPEEHKKKDHRDEEEDVLGEVEEPEEEHKKKDHRDEEEDVLSEVEEPEEEHKKKDHRDEEEDVLGEVEEPEEHKKKDHRDEEEDVLGEVEEPEEHKKKDHRDEEEDVLGEVEQCTRGIQYWRDYNRYEGDPDRQVAWPIDEDTTLHGMSWVELVEERVPKSRAWAFMAQHYIVARLNQASGAPVPAEVAAVMAEVESLLGVEDPEEIDRVRAKDLMFVMRSYNNGHIGPGACGDDAAR